MIHFKSYIINFKPEWTYNQIAAGHTMVFHIAPKGKKVKDGQDSEC